MTDEAAVAERAKHADVTASRLAVVRGLPKADVLRVVGRRPLWVEVGVSAAPGPREASDFVGIACPSWRGAGKVMPVLAFVWRILGGPPEGAGAASAAVSVVWDAQKRRIPAMAFRVSAVLVRPDGVDLLCAEEATTKPPGEGGKTGRIAWIPLGIRRAGDDHVAIIHPGVVEPCGAMLLRGAPQSAVSGFGLVAASGGIGWPGSAPAFRDMPHAHGTLLAVTPLGSRMLPNSIEIASSIPGRFEWSPLGWLAALMGALL